MAQNLARLIEQRLPAGLRDVVQRAATLAAQCDQQLYLVGGIVRDTLLYLPNVDVDLVLEGDAVSLAKTLAQDLGCKLTAHERFGTAAIKIDGWTIDLITVRSESYAKPGALPTVARGTLKDDLFRRDFTINAMAVRLTQPHDGEPVDFYGGQQDLDGKLIRVLHEKSFIDDATRIWRAVRYEQRLGFTIEPKTLRLLKKNLDYLDTISADRIRHELERVLKEANPENVLHRAWSLKVLAKLHPSLRGDAWLQAKFRAARKTVTENELMTLYYVLLAYRFSEKELQEFITFLRPAKVITAFLRDTVKLKEHLEALEDYQLQPSCIYTILHDYTPTAITANAIATTSAAVRKNIRIYLDTLRYVKPILTGNDLQKMGFKPGPLMQTMLTILLDARLDGEVATRQQEEALAREWL